MKYLGFLGSFCMILCMLSCQRFVDFEVDASARMGITCFLSPDQTDIRVDVFSNQIIGTEGGTSSTDFVIKDADILIRNVSQDMSLEIEFDPIAGFYRVKSPEGFLQQGASYELTVVQEAYGTAFSTCQIPTEPTDIQVRLDSTFQGLRIVFFATPSWAADPQELTSYYRLIGQVYRAAFPNDPLFFFRWEGITPNPDYVEHRLQDGQLVQGPRGDLQAIAAQLSGFPADRTSGDSLYIDILHTTESYYQFQLDTRQVRQSDPLIAEPYTIYSNIEGAEGVFAAYAQASIKMRIR